MIWDSLYFEQQRKKTKTETCFKDLLVYSWMIIVVFVLFFYFSIIYQCNSFIRIWCTYMSFNKKWLILQMLLPDGSVDWERGIEFSMNTFKICPRSPFCAARRTFFRQRFILCLFSLDSNVVFFLQQNNNKVLLLKLVFANKWSI